MPLKIVRSLPLNGPAASNCLVLVLDITSRQGAAAAATFLTRSSYSQADPVALNSLEIGDIK